MRPHRDTDTAAPDQVNRHPTRRSRVLAAAAFLTLMGGGLVACATDGRTAAEAAAATGDAATSTTGSPISTSTPATREVTTTPTTTRATTATEVPPTSVTSVQPTSRTTTPATTVPSGPGNSAGYIQTTYDAWTAGDRAAAASVAEPAAVDTLFARTWTESARWAFVRCEGAAGSVFCVWHRPGEDLLMKARNTSGGAPVNAVQFRAAA